MKIKLTIKNEYFGRDEFSNSVIVKTNENIVGKFKNIKILTGNQNSLKGEINLNAENKNSLHNYV